MVRALVVLVVVLRVAVAGATSYGPPRQHDVGSPDGRFVLHVDPEAQRLSVATAAEPTKILWSVPRRVGFERYFVANGGERVAVVAWRFVQVDQLEKPGVEILGRAGQVAVHSVDDLIAHPPRFRGVGPIGSFWRKWLSGVRLSGDRLIVETTGMFTYVFDLRSGERARELRMAFVAMFALGLLMFGLAALVVVWTRRAQRHLEATSERRRFAMAVAAMFGMFVWLGLDLAGSPVVPDGIELAVWGLSLVMVPVSLVAIAKLPPGRRLVRLLLTLAVPVVLVTIRFVR